METVEGGVDTIGEALDNKRTCTIDCGTLQCKEVAIADMIAPEYRSTKRTLRIIDVPSEVAPSYKAHVTIERTNRPDHYICQPYVKGDWVKGHRTTWKPAANCSFYVHPDTPVQVMIDRVRAMLQRTTSGYVTNAGPHPNHPTLNKFYEWTLQCMKESTCGEEVEWVT